MPVNQQEDPVYKDKGAWAAYMRDYRRRKRLALDRPSAKPIVHAACDARIAEQERMLKAQVGEIAALRARVADLERMLEEPAF